MRHQRISELEPMTLDQQIMSRQANMAVIALARYQMGLIRLAQDYGAEVEQVHDSFILTFPPSVSREQRDEFLMAQRVYDAEFAIMES